MVSYLHARHEIQNATPGTVSEQNEHKSQGLTLNTAAPNTRTRKRKTRSVGRPRKSGNTGSESPAEEILRVASGLFSTKGYAGTTMAEIADTVGIRGPSLYYHFELKSEILRAISTNAVGAVVDISERLFNDADLSPTTRVYLLVYETVLRLRASSYELNCLFDPVFQEKEFRDLNQQIFKWMRVLEKSLKIGTESEHFNIEDVALAADSIRGLIAVGIRKPSRFNHLEHQDVARHTADFALRSIVKTKAAMKTIQKEISSKQLAA